jgi:hypothetical protein
MGFVIFGGYQSITLSLQHDSLNLRWNIMENEHYKKFQKLKLRQKFGLNFSTIKNVSMHQDQTNSSIA